MDNFKQLYNEADKRLQAIDPIIRSKVLIAIENDIQKLKANHSELTEPQLITRWQEGAGFNQKLLTYLKEYGIHQIPQPEKSLIKTMVIAFAVVVVSFFILIGVMFSLMSPVLEFNDKGIALLGGRFQISNGINMDIKTSQNSFQVRKNIRQEQGKINLSENKNTFITINKGHIILNNTATQELVWECVKPASENYQDQNLNLSLGEDNQCHLHLPQNKNYTVNINQGLVSIHDPKYNLNMTVNQGQVQLKPDELLTYKFDVQVIEGVAEVFEGQEQNFDYSIQIKVNEGMITHSY
ncbi:MAG: hypothetical protein MK008_06935 [Bdellovibrionales bacterium]|nr:hypothetical protein [Bdellovibrionales bacterium]